MQILRRFDEKKIRKLNAKTSLVHLKKVSKYKTI